MFSLDSQAPNIVPVQYRQVSVAQVDIDLDDISIRDHFVGREAYMRTRFIVVRSPAGVALVEIDRVPTDDLFSLIDEVRVLAGPRECRYVCMPDIDVGIPAQLAVAADAHPTVRCVIVEGAYSHVSFVLNPAPLRLAVLDIVPPAPSKLYDQTRRILDVAEDLPPILLTSEAVDSRDLLEAASAETTHVLLPCKATGLDFGTVEVDFLDQRPTRTEWTILGCQRTRQIHDWFYDTPAPAIDTCPRQFLSAERDAMGATLTRCCLLQQGIEQRDRAMLVPWGSSLAEVRQALDALVTAEAVVWTPV